MFCPKDTDKNTTVTDKKHAKVAPEVSSGKATGALVCGILAIVFFSTGIVGVVLGIIAVVLARKAFKSTASGKASAAKICGIVGIVLSVLSLVFYVAFFAGFLHLVQNDDGSSTTLPDVNASDFVQAQPLATARIQGTVDVVSTKSEAQAQSAVLDSVQSYTFLSDSSYDALAKAIKKSFRSAAGFELSSLGMSGKSVAGWLVDNASYEIATPVVDEDKGVAKVTVKITGVDSVKFQKKFIVLQNKYMKSDEFNKAAAKGKTKKIYRHIGALMKKAMRKTPNAHSHVSVKVTKTDSSGKYRWSLTNENKLHKALKSGMFAM